MKKLKLPVITFIFSIIFIAVGYANWGETNELGSSVRTGELDLKYENKNVENLFKSSKYVDTSVDIVDDKAHEAKVTLSNMYPGAWAMFKLQVVNSGTIPAKLENVEMNFEGDASLLKYLQYNAGISVDKNGDSVNDWRTSFNGILINFESDFNREIQKLSGAFLESNNLGKLCLGIPSNDATDIDNDGQKDDYVFIKFDEAAPDDTQNKTISFNLKLNFKQFSY
jgi:hypothetical protein